MSELQEEEEWEDTLFPYDEPYEEQRDGIKKATETIKNEDVLLLEGACGTGKTLISIISAILAVRDPSTKLNRVMVATDVKQQTRQFIQDIQDINDNLPSNVEPIKSIAIVGKSEMCPWKREEVIDNIYSECDDLRNNTINEMNSFSKSDLNDNETPSDKKRKNTYGMFKKYEDMVSGDTTTSKKQTKITETDVPLSTAGTDTIYPQRLPQDIDDKDNYCPFYSKTIYHKLKDEKPISHFGMMAPEDLIARSMDKGVCPHSEMASLLKDAEIIIGNNKHVFDSRTVNALTKQVLKRDTVFISDEAHNIVRSVREELSKEISYTTIRRARTEIKNVLDWMNPKEEPNFDKLSSTERKTKLDRAQKIKENLRKTDYGEKELRRLHDLLDAVASYVASNGEKVLNEEQPQWEEHRFDIPEFGEEYRHSLRDPGKPEKDSVTKVIESEVPEETLEELKEIGGIVDDIYELVYSSENPDDEDQERDVVIASRVFHSWWKNDHETYFRQLLIEPRDNVWEGPDEEWRQVYRFKLRLLNCIPKEPISKVVNFFGASIFMSATLAPLEMFEKEIGLDRVREKDEKEVNKSIYGLDFPEENRESIIVDVPKFTTKNRGDPFVNGEPVVEENETRWQYSKIIKESVKETPGNFMVCMPSYREAEWAKAILERSDIDVTVGLDKSTTNKETQELKEDFVDSDKFDVLVTSTLGTLVEGVDYPGDDLNGVLVCGVPIENTYGDYKQAVRVAYESEFGKEKAFSYAFVIPAVRKARQSIGRVIRGEDDVGVRIFADERYAKKNSFGSVGEYLPSYEWEDFKVASPDMVSLGLRRFWNEKR